MIIEIIKMAMSREKNILKIKDLKKGLYMKIENEVEIYLSLSSSKIEIDEIIVVILVQIDILE